MTRKIIRITSLILFCVNVPAFADDVVEQWQQVQGRTLRGLNGLHLVVESLDPNIKEHGLTEEQIRTDTEVKLRTAGIRVIPTKEEWVKEPGAPYLYILVETYHVPKLRLFSLSIHVELKQVVLQERDPTVRIPATTWEIAGTGIVGEDSVQQIRNSVKDKVDQFINAYLTENPKK